MKEKNTNRDFQTYIKELAKLLKTHGANTDALQESQVNGLVELERQFRKELVRHPHGINAYAAFIAQCKNILTARPMFRERDMVFKSQISSALKAKDPVALTRFDINSSFIKFVLGLEDWSATKQGRKMLEIAAKISKLRNDLIECNLPLAISQARTFFGRNLQSHLEQMEFTQIAASGLIEAIDKFSGPYTRTFRAVCIGRMLGNLIEDNSMTYVHYYPAERKGLYRMRKLLRQLPVDGPIDYDAVHRSLNQVEAAAEDKLTSHSDMLAILSASQPVLLNEGPSFFDDDKTGMIERFPDSELACPDVQLERAEIHVAVRDAIEKLPLVDRKVLSLRGVDFCVIVGA